MTRTSRAAHPRAVNKDRSISRTGYDKSIQKNGAGNHNWGSIDDELELEDEALSDEGLGDQQPDRDSITADAEVILGDRIKKSEKNTNPALSLEEIQHAQKYRKKALRSPDLDLAEIARTSAAVVNSPPPIPSPNY